MMVIEIGHDRQYYLCPVIKYKEVAQLRTTIVKNGTLTKSEFRGKTFKDISPDKVLYGFGFAQQRILEDSQKYIDLHYQYAESGTPEEKVQRVYDELKAYLTETAETPEQLKREIAGLDHYWPQMQGILRKQAGLTEIFLDYGCRSRIMYPYIARGANAMTLAIAYGMAFNIAGDFVWVSLDEVACFHIVWEAICVGVRRRGTVEVDKALAMSARLGEEWDLALLGAGVLAPWRLQKNVPYDALKCRIRAVDMDQRCIDWLPLVFGDDAQKVDATHVSIPKYSIEYSVENIIEFCQKPENQKKFKGAHMMGVLSYYRQAPEKALGLLASAERIIMDDGYILVDLQLRTTQSHRNSVTFWLSDSLSQDKDFSTAYAFMCELCDKLGLVCTVVDYGNELEEPSTAVFCLTKRK